MPLLIAHLAYCLSDHCPYFMILDRLNLCHNLQKTVTPNHDNALIQFKEKLHELCIIDNFDCGNNANPNENYNKFSAIVNDTISLCFQQKIVKFKKHKHRKSKWITSGIIRSIAYRDKLYIKLKSMNVQDPQHSNIKTNLKTYNCILRKKHSPCQKTLL